VVIFQPAEEGGAGAKAMLDDGMLDRFGIKQVYGMHNYPGMPVGEFGLRPGPIMAATDTIAIEIEGRGGHAARPHMTIDAVLVGAHIITAIQGIVARNVDPNKSAVISITVFRAGDADNVLPQTVTLRGTVRTFDPEVRKLIAKRLREVVEGTAAAHGAKAALTLTPGYPVLVNHEHQTEFAAKVAKQIAGEGRVNTELPPMMGAEDFSYMLQARPGAFIWVGNGDSAGLHHPAYNFNDEVIPYGTSYWVKLVETAQPA
jgi:hippurate hydrolase